MHVCLCMHVCVPAYACVGVCVACMECVCVYIRCEKLQNTKLSHKMYVAVSKCLFSPEKVQVSCGRGVDSATL